MAQDIDFSRMLDELDEPEATGFGTPVAEPSQAARDAFDLPGSTRKLIDDVVSAREADRRQGDYIEKGKEIISGLTDPQQYAEFGKGIVPGAISMGGTAIQAPDAITAKGQQGAAKFGRKQLEIMDRIDRGEAVPEMEDPIGYAYMSQEQRQAARAEQQQATAAFNPTPVGERPFFKAGEKVQKFAKDLMPAAPGYEESVGRQLGEGMGSMAFGLPLAYFGGPVVAGTAFGSAGIGEATQRAVEFDRKEKAAGRPGLTEDQIATAGILGIAPGATDMLPVEVLIGRLPLPIPEALKRPLAMAIGRIGGQAFIEGAQEGGQAFLQNLIAREVYNPEQGLVDGIGHEMGIGAGVGGIAETAKELGLWMLKSGAIRKKKGIHDSLVEHEKAQKEAAESAPEDTRALAASQEGETPRLKKGEGSVRGPASSEPAIQDAERLLAEINQGTIAQAKSPEIPDSPAEGYSGAPEVSETGATPEAPKAVPTFNELLGVLPRDPNGDPDLAPLIETLNGRPYNQLSDAEKIALAQRLRGNAPSEVAGAVSRPEATTPAPQARTPATEPRSLTEAIEEGVREEVQEPAEKSTTRTQSAPAANQIDDAARSRFSEVLSSKERRSNWGKAAGLSEEQVQALTAEAVADGRLTMRKGQPVRTAKGRKVAPATPLAQEAQEAVAVPMGRAAERRLEGVQDPLAYRHAAKLLGLAGKPRKVKEALKAAKKALKRAQADQIFNAIVPGAPRPKNIGLVFDAIEKALGETNAVGPALRDDARPLPEGGLSEGIRPDGEVGRAPDAPRDDLGGSVGDVGRPVSADADQSGTAGGVRGEGAGTRSDPRTGAGDRERGTDTPAAPETGLTPEQKAEVEEQVRSDAEKVEQVRRDRERLNYQITDADEIGKGGPKAKVRGNIAAIKKLREIEETGREPTEEDKKVLVKYVGWGAFAQDVFTDYKTEWKAERDQIKDLLSPAEYAAARASTLNAHYTSPEVIRAMWDGLKHLGFKGGRVLEPAAGIGHYIGLTPPELRSETAWTAVELDPTSAGITKALYGAADVRSAGFETQKWPDDFFDLAISNVPFGNFTLEDADTKGFLIHDYFFIKSLQKVRPGGVVAFITSAGTLDKENGRARTAMGRHATFLGAVRLPGGNQGAFKGNAGTDVTTDIIFFRKRVPGEPATESHDWRSLTEIKTPEGPTKINSYFAANPDMMLGKMRLQGSMYRAGEPVLIGPTENLGPKIVEAIQRGLPEGAMLPKNTTAVELAAEVDTATDGIKEGAFYEKDGVLYRKIIGVGQPQKLNATDKSKVRAFIGIRNVVNQMLGIQSTGGDSYNMGRLRDTLTKAYDSFVKAHGPINNTIVSQQKRKDGKEITVKRQPTLKLFEDDPDAFKVSAIEVYDEKTGKAKKAAIFTEDIVGAYVAPDVKGPADALAVSLNEKGKVDVELIASRLGVSEAEAIVSLGDQIYLNPTGEAWQPRAQYLSGDVVEKLEVARVAAELDPGRYMRNVEALEAVQPEPLTRQEISIPFGAPWVPVEVYQDFLRQKLGAQQVKLAYNPQNARWTMVSGYFGAGSQENFGTSERSVQKIVEYALNSESIVITTKGEDDKPVRMPEAEQEARARVDAIRELFSGDPEAGVDGWVWEDEARAERLEALYNRNYNRLVPQNYDGSHLTFPGLARVVTFPDGSTGTINLLPHRVNAIWRVIQKGNTLFNHVVGSGKTWTSIMAAMEMKRLGMVQRPMFVVPNHMLNQFATEFYQAYPNAKLLIATKDQMSSKRRREFAAKAAADKWDGIIITHSAFTRIGMQPEAYREFYEQQIEEMIEAKEQAAKDEGKDSRTVKDLEKARKQLETKLKKLTDESSKDVGVTFEELGVDYLILDEAHLFKSLQFATRHTRVKGISNKGESKRATDLFIKMRHLEKSRPGRSALFLTGTPVSNTMAELFTMQRYLQEGTLRKYGISQFDSWAGTFGKIVTKSELGSNSRDYVDTESFSQFVNMPELMAIVGDIMDTQTADMLKLPRPNLRNGKIDVVEAELSELEQSAIDQLVDKMEKRSKDEPFLPLFTQGIQLATDMRLVDPSAPFNPKGKIGKAIENIFKIWTEGNADPKAPNKAQIVFLDMGVPGSKGKRTVSTKDAAPVEEVDVAEQIRRDLMAEANAALGEDADGEAAEVDESDVQAQALLQGKFNLYQDIKDRLIEKGVPAEQIAFIHDAKNDDQKAKMFEKVRAGQIRVLIGSTGKMGVGTNVQRQLIAMHHLDAPWKPADVEQRDGRILRQGNKNPEVRILRYITKKSFDAYRWQLLDRKSNFIGQLFAGALGVRNAEDIDPPLPEAAELKAAATGNPLIVERAELEREVRTLEAAERAHVRGQKQAAVNAGKTRAYLETASKYAEAYEADAQLVTDLSGENFTVDLAIGRGDPVTVTERKKAGEAVRAYLLAMADRAYYGRKSDVTLGRISGFEMAAEIERTPDGFAVKPMIAGRESYSPNEAFLLTETSDPTQLIRRWEKLVGGVRQHVEMVRANIAKNTADLPKLEEAARPKPFAKAEMLGKAKGRLQEVISQLNAKPVPAIEEQGTPLQDIVNPIDRNTSVVEQLRQIEALTGENKPILDGQLAELDAALGTVSKANIKKPETILAKASRPSILATKPWHTVAHIRDTLRFKTTISSFDQIERAAEFMLSRGYRIVKVDTAKMLEPKEWGWRFAGFDLRAPNGQLIEWYIVFGEMDAAKKKGGHQLFEKWRNADGDELKARYDEYRADVLSSRQLYLEAFERGLQQSGYADLEDARADITKLSASLPEMSAKFSARSSAPGGANLPLGSQGPSADSRNLSPAGSMTQQRPEPRSSSTTGASISDTSSIEGHGDDTTDGNATKRREDEYALVAAPPADSYAIRSLQSIEDPVAQQHARALIDAGTNVEAAIGGMLADRRVSPEERQQIAETYVGLPVTGDPIQAIREAAAQRGRDARSALLHGFSPELSPSNLRIRDLDAQMLETALQRLADRMPQGALLAVRNALRLEVGERVAALEGATLSPEAALSAFGIEAGIAKKIVAVSLEYGPDVALSTFTHEEIHLLRQMGVLKGKAWEALAGIAKRRPKKAEAERILQSMLDGGKIDQATFDTLAAQAGKLTYRQLYQIDERYGEFLRGDENLLVEETVAHAAADWANGREFASPIERVFMRIRDLLEAIQNAMHGLGFRSANDIFESIWAGELTRKMEEARERRFNAEANALDWMQGEGITAMAMGPIDPSAPIDGATGQSMRRDLDALGFFSGALEAAKSWNQKKGTPEQALMWLKKSGVKDAEIEATGLYGFLSMKGSSVTREEVVGHLEGNRVGLSEVNRPNKAADDATIAMQREMRELGERINELNRQTRNLADDSDEAARIVEELSELRGRMEELRDYDPYAGAPSWRNYSLDPENPTYRETVLHLPASVQTEADKLADMARRGEITFDEAIQRHMATGASSGETSFSSGHFPEPNIIGHMMTSMTTHQGKPVYTIDQIQSDWGQKLRDDGAKDEANIADLKRRYADAEAKRLMLRDRPSNDPEREQAFSDANLLRAELATAEASAPGNPLVNTTDQWVNTTLRRAIRQAAEADAEYIAIPSGDTVLSYNPGDTEGMRGFYDGIVPKNLRNLLQKIDKATPAPERIAKLDSPSGKTGLGKGFTLITLTDKVKQSVISEGQPMFAFAGEKAKTADLDALSAAKEMDATGESRDDIWKQTGWFRGVDGKWRFEIDDSKSKLRPFGPDISLLHAELTHDPLFEAYPEMADFEFNRTATRSFQGSFTPGGILPSRIDVSKRAKDRRSVTLHEAQHGIQDIEGLAEGGDGSLRIANPITGIQARRFQQAMDLRRSAQELGMKVAEYVARRREWASDEVEPMAFTDLNGRPFDVESIALAEDDARISELQERQQLSDGEAVYRRLAGEVEARTVQKRMDMSEQERRERPPWMDYDVPEDRQIVRMPVEGEQRSMASVEPDVMASFRDWMPSRSPTPPQATPAGDSPGLNKIISDLKKTLGMTVSQGLWGFSVQQRQETDDGRTYTRSARVRPPSNVRGQFDRETGNVSLRQSRDIKTLAHEGGHYLESILGSDLGAVKQQFAQALTGEPQPMPAALSEGFARWFESYILDPDAAEARAPGMTEAFEELLEAERPDMLEGFDTIQQEYQRYIKSAPIGEVAAGLSSQYDGTTWRELSKDRAFDNISGKLSAGYQGVIDSLNVAGKGIQYLLKTADANGIRDEDGRPISIKVGDNFYKRLRLFVGSFNRGRVWLEKGVSDLETGRVIGPSLKSALEKAIGAGKFNMEKYKSFNQYLVSIRAIAEYDRLDQKAATLKQYDDTLARIANARPTLAERIQRDQSTLDRRQDALTRANAMLADRRRMLGAAETRLETIQDRLDGVLADIAELGETGRLATTVTPAQGVPPPAPDMVRFYHGADPGMDPGAGERRWVTQDPNYARWFRSVGEPKQVWYVDVRKGSPEEIAAREWEDGDEAWNSPMVGRYRAQELPESYGRKFKRFDTEATTQIGEQIDPDDVRSVVGRRRRQVQNLERQQREALRAVERLSEEVSGRDVEVAMLQEEIRQLSEGVARGRQQVAQLDDMTSRIRKERELASNRGASRPPTAEPRAVHERVVKELGTPEFQEAAKLVHDFTFSLLEARRQAGFISQELFDELAKRRDWYVPFWRDMSDIEGAGAMFPGSGVKKWSMFKKFDGSDRSILMPLEILSEEAYSTAQQIAFNDMVKAMVGLAERVGPGGGKVAERLARSETMEANAETFDKIRKMATDLGVDEIDAHMITQRMEMNFSDGDIRVILSPENLGPTAKPQLPMWENGERVMVRLPDPAFGRDLFNAINGLGKEMGDILVKSLALPAQVLRVGVTSHPDFIFRNIWRDIWTAWKLTGAAPFVTQFRGFGLINERGTVDGMSGEDFLRLYNEAGGIAGGINVNAQISDQRRDVKALLDTNIDPKAIAGGAALGGFTGLAAGSSVGSLLGAVFGGPVGAAVGFKIGATVGGLVGGIGTGYAARHGEVWRFVESFETATRLGVAAHAYKRAKAHNPDLSDMEAITEAAFVSRDVMDWNRRGSKMLAATRLVTFLNAQIQGLDKQLRQMGAVGDRGSALKKQLAIVFKHQSNDVLSRDEERDLADSYKSYMRWGAITLMLMGLAALYADDDDYQDIKDETKATHSWFKALGIWFRLPKPFELAVPGNIGEIVWDKVAGRDQRMGERIVDSMYEVLAPPGLPQAMRLTGGLLFNRDRQGIFSGRSREIVGANLASRPPHERYHAFSSEFAIDLSRAMYLAGVPQSLIPAPVKTDFVLSAAGAYWGREVQNSYQTAKTIAGMSTRPDRRATDFPILRGFTGEAARMSRGVNDMWSMISRDGGEMTMAANEYKRLMDDAGRPVEAEMWLKSLDPEQQVWALTQYYGSRSEKREHPLERASQADRINREIMRDTISDTLAPKVRQGRKTIRDYDEKIELTPAKKTEVIDILARLSQVEARNTMILMKRPGFEGMGIKDPQLLMDELKAASPPVHDLLLERRDKKVADWPDVVKEWPKYRDRVLEQNVNAF